MNKKRIKGSNFFVWIPEELNFVYYKAMFRKVVMDEVKEFLLPFLERGCDLKLAKASLKVSIEIYGLDDQRISRE